MNAADNRAEPFTRIKEEMIVGVENRRICPVERAGHLESRLRRWLQNPFKIVGPYLKEGMTVLDLGCGPGLFSIAMAEMVGASGQVVAADLQEGMLSRIREKIRGTALEDRITLHRCEEQMTGLPGNIDFVLAFYMVHEVPDQAALFREIASRLKPGGHALVVEPPFHVSKKDFAATLNTARDAGLSVVERPKVAFSKAALLRKI